MAGRKARLSYLTHPYRRMHVLTGGRAEMRASLKLPGSALVWPMAGGVDRSVLDLVVRRPGGVSLLVILPAAEDIAMDASVMHAVHRARPHGVLPFHPSPSAADLAQVLRRPPVDLAGELIDYLRWRGLGIDRETAHLVRRIIDLSAELRSISAVSRSMYLSRRALGRRLMSRGLPVPSHWLQMGRLLRVALKLQNTDATVSSVAFELGYPDGFSVSNQMERLLGYRPSDVRTHLGWEWLVEAWLRREAELGGLGPSVASQMQNAPTAPADPMIGPRRRSSKGRPGRRSAG